jgi:hypothetical protein
VAKHIADLGEGCTSAKHLAGRSVSKAVRPHGRDSGALRGSEDRLTDPAERSVRRANAEEDAASVHARPAKQVCAHGGADVVWKRKLSSLLPLAPNGDHAESPVEVVEGEGADLALAQAEACEEEEDCIVAFSDHRPAVAAREHALNVR